MSVVAQIPEKPAVKASGLTHASGLLVQRKRACGGSAHGECEECQEKEATLQRRAIGTGPTTAPPIVHDVLRSAGQPLDAADHAFFRPRFGHDFSKVRVHTDGRAAESARSVNASAYTVGDHVVFGEGQYSPSTTTGGKLLAHELAHTVQQSRGGQPPLPESYGQLERDADRAADQIGHGGDGIAVTGASAPSLAREPAGGKGATGGASGGPPKAGFQASAADLDHMETVMTQIAGKLDAATRKTLSTDKTLDIGLVVDSDGDPTLVYTVSGDWINPALDKATKESGVTRWNPGPGRQKRGAGGAPGDAEQRMIQAADENDFVVKAMVVSRRLCGDCGPAVEHYEHGPILVRVAKLPAPTGGGAAGPGGKTGSPEAAAAEAPKGPGTKGAATKTVEDPAAHAPIAPAAAAPAGKSAPKKMSVKAQTPAKGPSEATPEAAAKPPAAAAPPAAAPAAPQATKAPLVKVPAAEAPEVQAPAVAKPAAGPKAAAPAPEGEAAVPHVAPPRRTPAGAQGAHGDVEAGQAGAAAGVAAAEVVKAVGGLLIQKYFLDEQNQQEFQKAVDALQPEIEKQMEAKRSEVAALTNNGKTAYANVTLFVKYQSDHETGLNFFAGLSLEKVEIGSAPVEKEERKDRSFLGSLFRAHIGNTELYVTFPDFKYEPKGAGAEGENKPKAAPQPKAAAEPPGSHATPPGVHVDPTPKGFPTVEEQQGKGPCPNCHDDKKGGRGDSGFSEELKKSAMTEEQLKEWAAGQGR